MHQKLNHYNTSSPRDKGEDFGAFYIGSGLGQRRRFTPIAAGRPARKRAFL